jgi:very-short-patch-repair endonuclease
MRLVIEVDGPTHDATVEEDAIRQQVIQNQGITFLRFKNDEVFDDLPSVLERIMNTAGVSSSTRSPSPPPRRTGRGPGGGV